MSTFTIDVLAVQCGVSTANLRAWQRCGLIEPKCDAQGHRYYNFTHVTHVMQIVRALASGIALGNMAEHLQGSETCSCAGWQEVQALLLENCKADTPARLRDSLWRLGRELPPGLLVNHVIRPLRQRLLADKSVQSSLWRIRLDSALTEYATRVVAASRKRTGGTLLILGMNLLDSLEPWLEAIRYGAEGLRLEVLAGAIALPPLTAGLYEHIIVWNDIPLSPQQAALFRSWQQEGLPVIAAGSHTIQTLQPQT